jgi:hypothetical protein
MLIEKYCKYTYKSILYNTVRLRVSFDNLEFNSSHTTTNKECITLANGSVGLQKVGLQEGLKEITGQALHCVVNGQNVDTLTILDIRTGMKCNHITQTETQVVTNNFI